MDKIVAINCEVSLADYFHDHLFGTHSFPYTPVCLIYTNFLEYVLLCIFPNRMHPCVHE